MALMKVFAPRIRAAIEVSCLKQKEIAFRLGVPEESISRWVNGKRMPPLDIFEGLAAVTGANAEWLLGLDFRAESGQKLVGAETREDVIAVIEAAVARLKEFDDAH